MATISHRRSAARIRFGPRSAGTLMTPEEFDATPEWAWDDRYRYELIRGVLVVSPAPSIGERDPNGELEFLLRLYQGTHPQGHSLDLTVSEQTVPLTAQRRRADRVIWAGLGRIPDPNRDVPTIVVEFVSSQRRDMLRDYETKRDEYLAAGAREYWIIDRFRRIMTIYRKGTFGPVHQIVFEAQTYETELLPGFALPLARLLSLADRWKKTRPRPKRSRKPKPPAAAEGSQ
jgi:Uma2 family endonuclease